MLYYFIRKHIHTLAISLDIECFFCYKNCKDIKRSTCLMVKVNILVFFRGKELVKKKLALIRKEEKETAAKQLKESQV